MLQHKSYEINSTDDIELGYLIKIKMIKWREFLAILRKNSRIFGFCVDFAENSRKFS